jgi:hypothetical protein
VVPETLLTLCDLVIFVDEAAEPVEPCLQRWEACRLRPGARRAGPALLELAIALIRSGWVYSQDRDTAAARTIATTVGRSPVRAASAIAVSARARACSERARVAASRCRVLSTGGMVLPSPTDHDAVGGGLFEHVDELVELDYSALVLLRDARQASALGVGDKLAGLVSLAAVLGEEVNRLGFVAGFMLVAVPVGAPLVERSRWLRTPRGM